MSLTSCDLESQPVCVPLDEKQTRTEVDQSLWPLSEDDVVLFRQQFVSMFCCLKD